MIRQTFYYPKITNISPPEYKPPNHQHKFPPDYNPLNITPSKNKVKGDFQVQPLNLSKSKLVYMSIVIGLKDIRTVLDGFEAK